MVERKIGGKKKMSKAEFEESLIDNFINLQRVLTNLTIRFEEMSGNISKLLQLFEISAKSFAERGSGGKNPEIDKEFLKKLDSLLDQNKVISKGIMLMEERVRNKGSHPREQTRYSGMMKSRPVPRY